MTAPMISGIGGSPEDEEEEFGGMVERVGAVEEGRSVLELVCDGPTGTVRVCTLGK